MTIFEGMQRKLPINRVIVGPEAGESGIAFARSLVDAQVTLSEADAPRS